MAISPWVTWPALTKYGSLGVISGLLVLASQRIELLENNMFDLEDWDKKNAEIVCDERSHTARTEDGTCNILENPAEGSAFVRFGRNVNPNVAHAETEQDTLLIPNPREVSNVLMSRGDDFKPATTLNFIAASWIQFMVHDWFDHGPRAEGNPIEFALPSGDKLGSGTMSVRRTQPDPSRTDADGNMIATYQNINTHWWDGSQIYGSDKETNDEIRAFSGGKLKLTDAGTLPTEFISGKPVTGFNENWWVGLSMMHRLFTLEHNAIADRLAQSYPDASDQWIYDRARLVNAALMAKIHTVEWTPAILANPVLERAMYANWWGLGGDQENRDFFQKALDDLNNNVSGVGNLFRMLGIDTDLGNMPPGTIDHALGGLVGAREPNDYGVPYTLTEEFVSVYRMHPLLRDEIEVYDIGSNIVEQEIPLPDTRDGNAEDYLDDIGADKLWYSFGITHPGSLTLENYPDFMRELSMPIVGDIDMAAIDVLRDRERGVPRYNEFRREIGLKPITKFEDLTADPELLANLKRLYNNDIEMIDTLVGQLAEETRPDGFGFGETAFQIFILNASRRLMTDRFFTTDYVPEVYTQEGIDWVEANTMVDVIRRHYPSLSSSLAGMDNAFQPWGLNMPEAYETWSAEQKQNHLWTNGVLRTEYQDGQMPAIDPVDIGGLISSVLWDKVNRESDVAPAGYDKPIHANGVTAKVAFQAVGGHPYTGLFTGADHGILRLSVTGDPNDRGFAPGLALKLFNDGKRSQNISALYTLSGQDSNHNFFANEMSNYVSPEANDTLGSTVLFSLVTTKPTLLMANDISEVNQDGTSVADAVAPTQIYFVPNEELRAVFDESPHDFRDDLLTLGEGTKLYDVYATSENIRSSIFPSRNRRLAEERRNSAVKVGELTTTSEMVASQFGDSGMFFKHERYEDR
ncbi:peroxidase family protein [Hydrocarboniclastica marina]|uniref:Peroxidase n=1 Tax=Hydrocarboniclastica marina TaxID=2259620 RepID=A0A4P7XJB8_9ALTE|nr:peroxidase family protein [Hydrocarboniclastica marina]QCF27138.1 peroxidase [Hydrocarboniclastica marina]